MFKILYTDLLKVDSNWWIERYVSSPNMWRPAALARLEFIDKYRIQLEFDFQYSDDWYPG
jgi:hypothetical protein